MHHTKAVPEQTSAVQVPTIAQLIARVEADASLPEKKRADICSGVRSLCRALKLQPASAPADAALIAALLRDLTPAGAGMSKGRLQNCRSHMDAALVYADDLFRRRRSRTVLPPHLRAFLNKVIDRWDRTKLLRFTHFLNESGIAVEDVSSDTFDAFRESLGYSLVRDARRTDRETRRIWNTLHSDNPERQVQIPNYTGHYSLPESAFPETLSADADAYLSSRMSRHGRELDSLLTEEELFGDGRPAGVPLRPATAKLVRYRLRQFASIIVRCGVLPAHEITSLKVLVRPDIVVAALNEFIKRTGCGLKNSQIKGIANDLLMIAKLWVKSPDSELAKLQLIVCKVRPVHQGLPERVRRKLSPFSDVENVRAFLSVPDRVVAKVQREKTITPRSANLMAAALWIAIAQRAPLRIANLVSIDLKVNLLRSHSGKHARAALFFPPEQVKNGKTLEVPLSNSTVKLLELYLSKYRPALINGPCDWLFPAKDGGHKQPSVMSSDIQKLMRNELGFSINPHSFRHLAAKLYLTAHPGRYADVQLLLGHRQLKTTVSYYVDLEAQEAFKHFDTVILGLKETTTVRVKEAA